jgi:hypothetical protein
MNEEKSVERLNVKAFSADPESRSVLLVHFKEDVNDGHREALLAAINAFNTRSTTPPAADAARLAAELRDCKTLDRNLDARVAVVLYSDTGHADPRDNTHARLPSKSDECAPGTYWISSFSGLSLRAAPGFTGDKLLRDLAVAALGISPPCKWCPDGCGWYTSNSGGFARWVPCDHCNYDGLQKPDPKAPALSQPSGIGNPCAKIFDHKWLDPECVETGCRSLFLKRLAEASAQLVLMARTSGGTAGRDDDLCRACDAVESALSSLKESGR